MCLYKHPTRRTFVSLKSTNRVQHMKRLLSIWLWMGWMLNGALGQATLQVYPGDVTNNGQVNAIDFLHLGLAYNYSGPARDSASLDFTPIPAEPWPLQFPGGLNMAYADCNGDGYVNYYFDAFPLYTNYGQERDSMVQQDVFVAGVPGIDPPLKFDDSAVPNTVQAGQTVRIPLELGSANIPAEDFYGIAFSIIADPTHIDLNQISVNFAELSWINPDNDRIWMTKKADLNRVDVGLVRTDKNQRSGYGQVGYADFVIIVDVIVNQQIPIVMERVKMMDKYGNYSTVASDTIWLNVSPESLSSNNDQPNTPRLEIYPNPASDQVLVKSSAPVTGVQLVDMLGQVLWSVSMEKQDWLELKLPTTPNGLYLLKVETTRGMACRTLQIQH